MQTSTSPTERPASPLARVLGAPFEVRTWRETLHLLLNLPAGIATFTVMVTGLSLGFGLLITLAGIPVLIATMYLSRAMAHVERARAGALLDARVEPPYRVDSPRDRWWRPHLDRFTDPATWIEFLHHFAMLPFGIATFATTVAVWSAGFAALFLPVYAWALPEPPRIGPEPGWGDLDTPVEIALVAVAGLVIVLAAPWVIRAIAAVNRGLVRTLLGATALTKRVHELTESRAAAVDLAAADRRQIERDLHDGVQQRLVSIAMDLGRAKEKLGTDPERAGRLVAEAHDEAKRALSDVRNLARGIHPAILTDRGLDPALSALAARSPVPVDVRVDVPRRAPASVEAAAYFVVSEALTNVAKHARAERAQVTVRLAPDGGLTIQVQDDGIGGADPNGAGLAGLRDRVRALDGEMHLLSPEGGPTVLLVELPCAS
jgi:signal transduction histidine kinase